MNTMEITKFVGAICGSLLVLLLLGFAAELIYHTESEVVAYSVEVEEPAADAEAEPVEEVDMVALLAEADPAEGEGIFRRCASCHNLEAGANAVGPTLHDVVDREIAVVEGYDYSEALVELEGAWDANALGGFLADPDAYAPGTKMAFAGLDDPADRADVIAYLATVTE